MLSTAEPKVSQMAENLIGSEIIKLAGEINEKIKNGEKIFNLTIGDFNPKIFPIPIKLKEYIIEAYNQNETNYPPADGILDLRIVVSKLIESSFSLNYDASNILISGGSRPLIFSIYQTILDPNDKVLFPVPSWNNNHYSHLSRTQMLCVETTSANNFMPTANDLSPYIQEASLISLCSPLNPTGTTFSKQQLSEICKLILKENSRRSPEQKPLYLMYDQVYSALTFGNTVHYDPVSIHPEMRDYTIYVDGISKSLSATGVRVGWAFGPKKVIDKMKNILGHVGAWAPKAEQVATAKFLNDKSAMDSFMTQFKNEVSQRLDAFYLGIQNLKAQGFNVNSIAPQAAIYLTVEFNLKGKITQTGQVLSSTKEITRYLLDEAKLAIVPFYAFGSNQESTWYRISVGTCTLNDIEQIMENLKVSLSKLS